MNTMFNMFLNVLDYVFNLKIFDLDLYVYLITITITILIFKIFNFIGGNTKNNGGKN